MDVGGIGHWVKRHAELSRDKVALVFQEEEFTFYELNERVNRLAHVLLSKGVRKGDRVAGLLLNCNQFVESVFACAKLGAMFVPINFRLTAPEVQYILKDSGAHVILYHTLLTPLLSPIRHNSGLLHGIYINLVSEGPLIEGDEEYESLLRQAKNKEPGLEVTLDDIVLMMYTSGTTGQPKGAMISHGNITWNAVNAFVDEEALETKDIGLTVAPLFHIGGLGVHTLPAIYKGSTNVIDYKFDPEKTLQDIEKYKVSVLFLVPAMWQALMHVPNFKSYDLSSLRALTSGGSPCPVTVIEFYQSLGLRFLEGFGMTETSPGVMRLGDKDAVRKHGSVGRLLMHVEARIVDDEDRDVPTGVVGELVLRGPNICKGYWHKPEANTEAFRGGWFHSGDLAKQDEEGFYYIVDRKKDMLISGGENIYPTEVEQVLYRHPKISELAVIGVPDEKWGEVPMAVVVLRDTADSLTIEEVQEFCSDKLARYKTPKHLKVIDQLPRNATGKILKRMLKEEVVS
jgi:fatty-acyl-CoA synthase